MPSRMRCHHLQNSRDASGCFAEAAGRKSGRFAFERGIWRDPRDTISLLPRKRRQPAAFATRAEKSHAGPRSAAGAANQLGERGGDGYPGDGFNPKVLAGRIDLEKYVRRTTVAYVTPEIRELPRATLDVFRTIVRPGAAAVGSRIAAVLIGRSASSCDTNQMWLRMDRARNPDASAVTHDRPHTDIIASRKTGWRKIWRR
jgi:hypothetical protein